MKHRVIKKVCLIFACCIMLTGCGITGQTASGSTESQTPEAFAEAETTEVSGEENSTEGETAVEEENSTQEGTGEFEEAAAKSTETSTEEDAGEDGQEKDLAEAEAENKDSESKESQTEEQKEEKKEPLVYTGPVQALETPKTLYSVGSVNIRKGPGTEYDKVGKLSFNETIEATGITENGWYHYMAGEQTCFVSSKYLSETKQEPKPAAPANTGSNTSGGVIMIGDSRCVQMQEAVGGGGCAWVCENSKGYKWLNEKAIGIVDPSVGKGTKVVFCLGVNDPGNVRNYAELVNAKAAEWAGRGASVYYVSVNPVWENPHVTQEQVDVFNSTMPSLLSGVIWIDTQSWLKENGYKLVDGLHYDDATSTNIFNLIMGGI